MDKAESFIKHNSPAEREAKYAIEKLTQLIQWKDNGNILDIGCGTGNVTHDILLPVLPKTTKTVIGIDNEIRAIEYAKKNYGLENKLTFQQVDVVSDSTFFENYEKTFDHIFSFSCLHFVREQETALKNIYKILKPGGDFNFCCVVSNNFFIVLAHMAKMEKWHPYLGRYEQYISPYQFAPNPKEELQKILTKVRFQVMNLAIEPRPLKLPVSYCPGHFVSHITMDIPTDLRIEFGFSCLDAIRELNFNSFDENNEEQFDYYFDTIVGHVTKTV